MEKGQTVYITKFALSSGIITGKVKHSDEAYRYIFVEGHFGALTRNEFFETREEALKDAERRRKEKIASLKKKIDKLEKITF